MKVQRRLRAMGFVVVDNTGDGDVPPPPVWVLVIFLIVGITAFIVIVVNAHDLKSKINKAKGYNIYNQTTFK